MEKVKVAVIGYGHLGKWHTQKAHGLENSELVAIVEPFEKNQEAARSEYPGVQIVNSIEDVLEQIDAAVIVTPTSTHFELTQSLLKAGKHVFCEKPLCSTYEQTKELEQYLGDLTLQVGHSERCHEAWELLEEDFSKLPAKKTIKITRHAAFKGRATDVDVVQDLMIHDIDLMLYLFKEKPTRVNSIGHKVRTDKWDHVTSHFFFESGMEVIITSGRNHVAEVRSLEVMSEHGCHYVDLFQNKIHFGTNTQNPDGSYIEEKNYTKRDHLLLEQENFYHSIINKTAPMVSYTDGVNAVYYVTKVLDSLEVQKAIEL